MANNDEVYCVKCRTKRVPKDVKNVTLKNGKPALQGICPVCGTRMFSIVSSKGKTEKKAA